MNLREIENYVRGMVERRLFESRKPASSEASETGELKVIAEIDVRSAGPGGVVHAARNAIMTPSAEELARSWAVRIRRGSRGERAVRRIALGSDHGGYGMKKEIARFLSTLDDIEVHDLGTHGEQTVDYPDFAQEIGRASCRERV